ncbi:uncharacterized protein KQ657_002470 [Scheffersomyces spartinae]|uniref:Glutathione peroxidase n=1 Tax=Scheffersomyces spartinae TaxID=45513 RepID=A0A9P7V6C9_9ASCO|nr:uncharacterized protein KQ657_002470 [Scheffersomyces spartinae]KAG7192108.1 hypothetical protein KQ657_002470 [Scheffersomyces spartinae]
MAHFKTKVILVVNVALLCGYTPQYKELEALYEKYKQNGLEIIAFPCNQFGSQEPDDEKVIVQTCSIKYGVLFPIMKKVHVNGDDEDPIYTYLKLERRGHLGFSGVRWNFEKFLISKSGDVVARYLSNVTPMQIEPVIVRLLEL